MNLARERDEYGVKAATGALLEFFTSGALRLTEQEATRLEELLDDYVRSRAEERACDALDREFNRGDYRG